MPPKRKIRYGKRQCRRCGRWISTNALARASHERSAKCIPRATYAQFFHPPTKPNEE